MHKPELKKIYWGKKDTGQCLLRSTDCKGLENFKVSGVPTDFYPDYVKAFAMVKLAAARANADVGRLDKKKLPAIEKTCLEVMNGKYHDQYLADFYQRGAGTFANIKL